MTMQDKALMRAYFDACHPMSPHKDEGIAALRKDYGLELVGEPVGGLGSVPYDCVPDSLATLRRLPAAMGNDDELRVVYGLSLIAKPKTRRMRKE